MHEADHRVVESIDVGADVHMVWRAWTHPDWLSGWLAERVDGAIVPGAAIAWRWDSLGLALDLEVVDCEPPHRLALRGGAPGRPPQMQTVELEEVEGATRVRLAHGDLWRDDERAGTAAGWRVALRVLAHYLDGRGGRRRECASALAPIGAALPLIGELLHDPERRAAWLAGDGVPAPWREGDRYRLRTADGDELGGNVIALAPPFQLALGWDEVDGVLILRAVQLAPGGPVLACAQAWSWAPERAAWRAVRPLLERAVARLAAAAGGAPGGAA